MTDDPNSHSLPDDDSGTPLPTPGDHPQPPDPTTDDWTTGAAAEEPDAGWAAGLPDTGAAAGEQGVEPDAGVAAGEPEDDQHPDTQAVADGDATDVMTDPAAPDEPFPPDDTPDDDTATDPLGDSASAALAESGPDPAWSAAAPVTGWSGTAVAPEPAVTVWAVPVSDPDPDYIDPNLIGR